MHWLSTSVACANGEQTCDKCPVELSKPVTSEWNTRYLIVLVALTPLRAASICIQWTHGSPWGTLRTRLGRSQERDQQKRVKELHDENRTKLMVLFFGEGLLSAHVRNFPGDNRGCEKVSWLSSSLLTLFCMNEKSKSIKYVSIFPPRLSWISLRFLTGVKPGFMAWWRPPSCTSRSILRSSRGLSLWET